MLLDIKKYWLMIWKENDSFPSASEATSPPPGVQGCGDGLHPPV